MCCWKHRYMCTTDEENLGHFIEGGIVSLIREGVRNLQNKNNDV